MATTSRNARGTLAIQAFDGRVYDLSMASRLTLITAAAKHRRFRKAEWV
jgi:hypothetical protein